ncbi:MAG: hypothetical protein Q8P01_05480 [bacterium]|nr:hypothetical protein [bacterium]
MKNNGSAKIVVIILVLAVVLGVGYAVVAKKGSAPVSSTSESQGMVGQEALVVAEDETENWGVYRNEKYGFEIKYPTGWRVQQERVYNQSGDVQLPNGLFEVSFVHLVAPKDYRVLVVRVREKQYLDLVAYVKDVENELTSKYWDGIGQVKPFKEERVSFVGRDAIRREEFVSLPIYSVRFLDGLRAFELVLEGGGSDFSDSDRGLYKLFESSFRFVNG